MKILSNIKRFTRRGIVLGALTAALFGASLLVSQPASAADCDNNAVVYCGASSSTSLNTKYTSGDGHNSAASIHNIYSWFGISSSDVASMKTTAQAGTVNKNGDVILNGDVVATGAITAGRSPMTSSSKHTVSGTTFYSRTPSVSFKQNSLPALIVMKNGVFQFAILTDCGNPVTGQPKHPDYSITKLVRVKGTSTYGNSITVKSGTTVEYEITVKSTGAVPVTNVTVKDDLPSNTKYVDNTLARDGAKVTTDTVFFTSGLVVPTIDNGEKTVFTFEAVVGMADTVQTCTAETLNNIGTIDTPSLPAHQANATVNKTCQPKPNQTGACTNVTAIATSDPLTYAFTANASVTNGAVVESFALNFGDGKTTTATPVAASPTTASANHTYAAAGTYTVVVNALITVNGKTAAFTSPACQVQVSPKPPTPPVYTCNSLTAAAYSRTQFAFTAAASASNGAAISGYQFTFGDGTTTTVPSSANSVTTQHTYTAPGTYTVGVSALVTVNGTTTSVGSAACSTSVTVTPAAAAECTGLTPTLGDNNSVSTLVTYTTSGGATLKSISYNFGDNSAVVVTSDTSQSHTYAAPGDYTIVATVSFNGASAIADSTCKTVVSFNKPQPTYTCSNFTIGKGENRTVTVTGLTAPVTNGAVFTGAVVNWGDNSAVTSAANIVGQTHTYAADGTYTISAVAHFTVNGQEVTAGGTNCQQSVSFTSTPPVTPPTVLVNTGPGSVLGIFAGVSVIAAFAHRYFLGRRLES